MTVEELRINYAMFKRVLAFFEMNKDLINAYPQLKTSVEKYKDTLEKIDDLILSFGNEKEIASLNRMNTALEFAKKFKSENKN